MVRLGFVRPLVVGVVCAAMVGACSSGATPQPHRTAADYWACEHEVSGLQNAYDALFAAVVEGPVVGSRAALDDLIADLHPDAYRYHDMAEGQRLLDRLTEFSIRLASPSATTEDDNLSTEVLDLLAGDVHHYISGPCTDILWSVRAPESEAPDPPFLAPQPLPTVSGGQTTFDAGEPVHLLVAGEPWADVTISNPSFDACPDAPRPFQTHPSGDACLTVDVRFAAHADGVRFYDDDFPAGPPLIGKTEEGLDRLEDSISRGYWRHPDNWETVPFAPWSVAPGSEMAMTWHYGVMPNEGRLVVRYAPVISCEGTCFYALLGSRDNADPPVFEIVLRP